MKMGKANTFVYLQDSAYQTFFPNKSKISDNKTTNDI